MIAWLSWGAGKFRNWGDSRLKIVWRTAGSNYGCRGFGISGIPVILEYLAPSVPGVGRMYVFLIQSYSLSIDTGGPADASNETSGHVDANPDRCADISLQLTENP